MSEGNIEIRVGVSGQQKKELYKNVEIVLQMHQDKLAKLNQEYCGVLNKTNMPFLVVEYPQSNLADSQIFNFKGKDYDRAYVRANNKLYEYANPKNKDTLKLIKNVEKQFQKLSKLNNNLNLKFSFYDVKPEEQRQSCWSLLNQLKIRGNVATDVELIPNLIQIVRRISNQFLNSPIMAFLELFQALTLKVELDKAQLFPQQLKESIKQLLNFGEWLHKQNVKELIKSKGQLIILITIPKLLSVKIKGDASLIGCILSAFS